MASNLHCLPLSLFQPRKREPYQRQGTLYFIIYRSKIQETVVISHLDRPRTYYSVLPLQERPVNAENDFPGP